MRNSKYFAIGGVDDTTYQRFRLLALGWNLRACDTFKRIVDSAFESEQTVPTEKGKTRMRRWIKKGMQGH